MQVLAKNEPATGIEEAIYNTYFSPRSDLNSTNRNSVPVKTVA